MAKISKISWTDGTLNFWQGCEKISEGCKNCYAEERDIRFHHGEHWGEGAPRLKSKSAVNDCRNLNRYTENGKFIVCDACGIRRWANDECCGNLTGKAARPTMFVMSLGDFGDAAVPHEWRGEALAEILKNDAMNYMILTKRPEAVVELFQLAAVTMTPAMRERVLNWMDGTDIPSHVAIGCTIENYHVAFERLKALTQIPAARRFVSAEPLLSGGWWHQLPAFAEKIHLVIVGGESGRRARPMHPAWARDIEMSCDLLDIPFHFKQWGEWAPTSLFEPDWTAPIGGNFVVRQIVGKVQAYDPHKPPTNPQDVLMWRAGKFHKDQNALPDGLGGFRKRTEILTFPVQAWRYDWWLLTGRGLTENDRYFPSALAVQEFIMAHPQDPGHISRTDRSPVSHRDKC